MVVRGVAGSEEKEFKERLSSQIKSIESKISEVNVKITVITDHVTRLLREMDLVHLEIGEAVVGLAAYNVIHDIHTKYDLYADRFF